MLLFIYFHFCCYCVLCDPFGAFTLTFGPDAAPASAAAAAAAVVMMSAVVVDSLQFSPVWTPWFL